MAYSECSIRFKVITKQGACFSGSLDSGNYEINAEAHEGDFTLSAETFENIKEFTDILEEIIKWFQSALSDFDFTPETSENCICTYGNNELKRNCKQLKSLKKDNIGKILVYSKEVYWDEPWGASFVQYDYDSHQLKEEFRESDPAVNDCYGDLLLQKFDNGIDPDDEYAVIQQPSDETANEGRDNKGMITFGGMDWKLLCAVEDRLLVLLEKSLGKRMPYNKKSIDVTWENCSLRAYLNNDFFLNTFSDEERSLVIEVNNINPDNPENSTPGGNNTKDRVFILSLEEVNQYLPQEVDRKNGTYWWLRTPGENSRQALVIDDSGRLMTDDEGWVEFDYCVRPAMWIKR